MEIKKAVKAKEEVSSAKDFNTVGRNGRTAKEKRRPSDVAYMVDRECRVEKDPGAMLEILLSYSDSRRTELSPVNVLLSMQVIWLLRSILQKNKTKHRDPKNINVWRIKSFGLTLKLLAPASPAKRGALFRQRKGSQDKRPRPVMTQIKDKTASWGGKFKPGPHRTTVTDPAI